MKKITYLLIALIIISCSSSDDDSGNSNPIVETYEFFPLTSNTYWTYNNDSQQGPARDSLYVSGTEQNNGFTYTVLGAEETANGFMTNLLSQNIVRATETEFILNGELGAPPIEGFPEITIPLDDLVLYDSQASNGTVLSEITGEIEQTIQDIPLVIGYTIKSVQKEILENGYVGYIGIPVLNSEFTVNLSITAVIEFNGVSIPIPVMAVQDVITVSNDYADGIGLIDSNTLIEYELEDLSGFGIDLPFPSEDSQTATQIIDIYAIGN